MKRSVAVTRPARISLEHRQLAIASADAKMTVPIEDLGILVLDHNAIDCTAPVLAALAEAGVVTVVANEKHLPCAYMHFTQYHLWGTSVSDKGLTGRPNHPGPSKALRWSVSDKGLTGRPNSIVRGVIFSGSVSDKGLTGRPNPFLPLPSCGRVYLIKV